MTQSCFVGALRGTDGTGIFAVPHDNRKEDVITYKKAIPGPDFIQMNKVNSIMNNMDFYKFFIGHNRAATYGKINSLSSHPFTIDNITLVHNGTLISPFSYHKDHSDFQVDSELIAHAIAKEGYKEALLNITGGAAVVWYDSKENTLNLFRNDQRTLYFIKVKGVDTSFIASEAHMMKWILYRNGIEIESVFEIKENTICKFKDHALPFNVEGVPKKKVVAHYTPINNTANGTENGLWKKQSKYTAKNILEDIKLTIGDDVEFQYDGITFNNPKSRHGALHGTSLHYPYFAVISYNVDPKIIQGYTIMQGKVSGVKPGDSPNAYEVILSNLKVCSSREDELVIGPNKTRVTKKIFNDLVKHGCSNCQVGLLPSIAEDITWLDNQTPLCKVCTTKRDINTGIYNITDVH